MALFTPLSNWKNRKNEKHTHHKILPHYRHSHGRAGLNWISRGLSLQCFSDIFNYAFYHRFLIPAESLEILRIDVEAYNCLNIKRIIDVEAYKFNYTFHHGFFIRAKSLEILRMDVQAYNWCRTEQSREEWITHPLVSSLSDHPERLDSVKRAALHSSISCGLYFPQLSCSWNASANGPPWDWSGCRTWDGVTS